MVAAPPFRGVAAPSSTPPRAAGASRGTSVPRLPLGGVAAGSVPWRACRDRRKASGNNGRPGSVRSGARRGAVLPGSGVRSTIGSTAWTLTAATARSRLDGLPRRAAERWLVGVRPFFENSTACQKSMPSFTSVCGVFCAGLLCGVGVGCFVGGSFGGDGWSLYESFVSRPGHVSLTSTESLILAQDERWRRA
jgi:hypothetical protein